ncbi:ATP-dependent zinc metalloprotease FtsH [Mycoplasmopsis agassizii]
MKNPKKKLKFSWFWAIFLIIAAAWLIWGLVMHFTSIEYRYPIESASKFQTDLINAARSTTDDIYFSQIQFQNQYQNLIVTYINGNQTFSYRVGASSQIFQFYTTAEIGQAVADQIGNGTTATTLWWNVLQSASTSVNSNGGGANYNSLGALSALPENPALSIFRSLLPILIIAALFIFYLRIQMSAQSGAGGGLFNPGKNQAILIKSDKTFKDIAGNSEAIEEVAELVDYLKNPKKYSASGARFPKGILLGGPPGTGKTLLAKATAGEANVPFFFISASGFVELYVGLGAKRVREMFKEARKESPAIIFIDELDAIGRSRGSGIGGGNDEREQTLNQILVEMDGITENSGILIMAATNRTDVLDPALLRPGRFDRNILVGLPDIKEREEILKLHAKGKRLSKEIDLSRVAKRTPGFSGAQLENVVNEAALLSVREKTGVITTSQIDEGIDRVMSGPAKKNRVISREELTSIAYHEAGHAVVGIKMAGGNKVQKITIIPRGNAGGYNLMLPETEKYNASKKELKAMIASFMGGRSAEEIIYGKDNVSTGGADDFAKATKIARRMVTEWGMSPLGPIKYEEDTENPFLGRDIAKGSFSSKIAHEIDVEVRKLISEGETEALRIIKENLQLLELIKEALLKNETIVAEEIDYIAKHLQLPPENKEETKKAAEKKSLDDLISETTE